MESGSSKNKNLTEDKIIVLKAKDRNIAGTVIQNAIYASANAPKDKEAIEKFVLIGHTDALGTAIWALGRVENILRISPTSKVFKVFKSNDFATWNWEFILYNIYDLIPSYLTIEDVFLPEDLNKIKHTETFTYVNSLKGKYNSMF